MTLELRQLVCFPYMLKCATGTAKGKGNPRHSLELSLDVHVRRRLQ
jgi:hypothetical protein